MLSNELRRKHDGALMPTYGRFPVALESGRGAVAVDADGKEYVDFGSGIGVNSLGYADPEWVAAVQAQAAKLPHISNLYYSPVQVEFADALCRAAGMGRVFLGNSGAEANECAIKLARKYSFDKYGEGRSRIIGLRNSFHGRTVTTLAATGQDSFHQYFYPFTEGFVFVDAGNITDLIEKLVELEGSVCAVMLECIQGEGGVIPMEPAYLQAVRKLCDEHDLLLLIDEVQTVPGKMLTLFNLAVNFLSEVCGATIVLCSATQPCLEAADHPLHRQPVDLVPQQKAMWDVFKRTDIQNAGCAKLEELPQIVAEALSSCDSLLVVCNTKKEAAFLFESLQAANCRCFHLSAAMCMQHRRETLQALQSALDKPSADRQRVVCVSTQVIEAGVDISFQRVIRFSAGMDSVVQAAGRCNRHAEQKTPAPVRLIRCTDERLRGLDDIVRGQNATTALLTAFSKTPEVFRHDLSSEESIRFYYRRLYTEMEPGFQDDQTQAHGSLYHLLADNPRYADANCAQAERYLLRQAFRLAGTLFQVFDEDTGALLVPYGRGRELQNTLRNAAQVYGQKDWAVIRGCIDEAKGYCVSVYRYQLERLEALGAVTSLFDGGVLLLSDGFYNEHTGFSLEAGTRDFQEV